LDEIDYKSMGILMRNGRMSWVELAAILRLSAPATADRVRRLEESGAIKGYVALIAPEALDYRLAAFISVTLQHPSHRADFLQLVQRLPEIQECHHVAGEDDYLLKIRCHDTADLDRLVSDEIKSLPGVARTRTTIVLSTLKETTALPCTPEEPA
jgi:Lrp/AsnC family transcriptional regulator, leucine-responsive regulatory protein